jgi:ElaB/YqjD/DUF883 family membrane-anchored ribosome-binding protein
MLGQSGYSRAMLPNVREIERRLRSLEQQLERVGGRTSASTAEVAERAGAAIAPVLSSIADRFRGGTHSMSDEAAKLGNDALRRLSNEVEHRPLVTLAVAVGVGILVGLASHSAAAGAPRAAMRLPRRRVAL